MSHSSKSLHSTRLTESEFNEQYQAFIQQPIDQIKITNSLVKQLDAKKNPLYLAEDTLYLDHDVLNESVRVYSVGLKSQKHVILESDKAWSWDLTSKEYVELHAILNHTKNKNELIDKVIKLCGCIQPKKLPKVSFISDDSKTQLNTRNALENFSRILAKRIFEEQAIKKNSQEKIYQSIYEKMNGLDKGTTFSDTTVITATKVKTTQKDITLTSHFITLMYYCLDQYLTETNSKITMDNLNLLLAASFCYVNKLLVDKPFVDKEMAEFFNVDCEELILTICAFLQVNTKSATEKLFLEPAWENPEFLAAEKCQEKFERKVTGEDKEKIKTFKKKEDFSIPSSECNSPDIYIPQPIFAKLKTLFETPAVVETPTLTRQFFSLFGKAQTKKSFVTPPTPCNSPR